ncbi:hypothetical protein RE628_19630 [Paenibacillus sp. D2_2]|uniref:SecDF P1 head subdomain-containing protein n=1 Tax=Paenibacillus sp. D2_2 TaxID=3073092 RepID=UPI0028165077|nr:hypothetical protein [Paenibacillus sp. D2_2]WMT39596.1 hypothetical protein RE628_19630 [Paenibacillus sp. D2_2]
MKFRITVIFSLFLSICVIAGCNIIDLPEKKVEQEKTKVTFEDKDRNVLATGADLDMISVAFSEDEQVLITGRFKEAKKFEEITRKLLGKELSIYCDEDLITSPIVSAVLTTGEFTIKQEFTLKEANELVYRMRMSME